MQSAEKSIVRFICKTVAIAAPVALIFLMWYVSVDPFRVLREYDEPFLPPEEYPVRVGINKGLVTINNYLCQSAEGNYYNTFIFGSSISAYYDVDTLLSLLRDSIPLQAMHFDSAGESPQSMARKVMFLDRSGAALRHALIVLDPLVLGGDVHDAPFSVDHHAIADNPLQLLKNHYLFFRASTNADFMKSWIPAKIYCRAYNNGRNRIFECQPIRYNPSTNQESIPEWDRMIKRSPESFYKVFPLPVAPDSAVMSPVVITPEKECAFRKIAEIFQSHSTDYQIIISPNRRKVVLNPIDSAALLRCFAPERVHDFTKSHLSDLECDTLLYDVTHYRPVYSNRLMREVYRQ